MKFILPFILITVSCQSQKIDTTNTDEDLYDNTEPFLLANNHIKGLNIKKPFQRGDTVVYWLLVSDTFGGGGTVTLKRLPGLKFNVPFLMRAYGLNRVDSVLGWHVALFDPLWHPLIRDSLLIIRILQDTILEYKGPRRIKRDDGPNEITVEDSGGLEIEVWEDPVEAVKPD